MKHIGIFSKCEIPRGKNIETEFSHTGIVNGRLVEYYHAYRVQRDNEQPEKPPTRRSVRELWEYAINIRDL